MAHWMGTCPACGEHSSAAGSDAVVALAMKLFHDQHQGCNPANRVVHAISQIDADTAIAVRQVQARFQVALEIDRQYSRLFDQQNERLRQQFAARRSDYYNQLCDQWLASEQAMGFSQGGRHV